MQYVLFQARTLKSTEQIRNIVPHIDKSKKVIMIEWPDQAAYMPNVKYMHIVRAIVEKFKSENVLILSRYKEQKSKLFKMLGKKARIIDMKYDGKALLEMCMCFTGGTMTAYLL